MATLAQVRHYGGTQAATNIGGVTVGGYASSTIARKYINAAVADTMIQLRAVDRAVLVKQRDYRAIEAKGAFVTLHYTGALKSISKWEAGITSMDMKINLLPKILSRVIVPQLQAAAKDILMQTVYSTPAVVLREKFLAKFWGTMAEKEERLARAELAGGAWDIGSRAKRKSVEDLLSEDVTLKKYRARAAKHKAYYTAYTKGGGATKRVAKLSKVRSKKVREGVFPKYTPTYNLMVAQIEGITAVGTGVRVAFNASRAPYYKWVHEGHETTAFGHRTGNWLKGRPWIPQLAAVLRTIMEQTFKETAKIVVTESKKAFA